MHAHLAPLPTLYTDGDGIKTTMGGGRGVKGGGGEPGSLNGAGMAK